MSRAREALAWGAPRQGGRWAREGVDRVDRVADPLQVIHTQQVGGSPAGHSPFWGAGSAAKVDQWPRFNFSKKSSSVKPVSFQGNRGCQDWSVPLELQVTGGGTNGCASEVPRVGAPSGAPLTCADTVVRQG